MEDEKYGSTFEIDLAAKKRVEWDDTSADWRQVKRSIGEDSSKNNPM